MSDSTYELPPNPDRTDGEPRRVGFELEFSGIDLEETVAAVQSALNARIVSRSPAEVELDVEGLGRFNIEIDWQYLKRKAAEKDDGEEHEWIQLLSQAAALLVPVEVVCPPIPVTRLDALDAMVQSLREAGAVGTEESLIAAYGVHINTEIPDLGPATIASFLKAYALLQWWLFDKHEVDMARRISPYIDLYPRSYLRKLLSHGEPTMEQLFDDYLEHNASRNRALDLLPLLAEIDEKRLRRDIDDPRINARPAFHYRLPDCHIEDPGWSLRDPWGTWLVVEKLAARPVDLERLGREFLGWERPLIGVSRDGWVENIDRWLHDHELA